MKESEKTEFKKSLAELGDGLNSIAAILNNSFINAFCHRDYRDLDEVRIAVFPDRVEVRNPGTHMEGVALRNLKTAKVSRRRNPLIADLLRRINASRPGSAGSLSSPKNPKAACKNTASTQKAMPLSNDPTRILPLH